LDLLAEVDMGLIEHKTLVHSYNSNAQFGN